MQDQNEFYQLPEGVTETLDTLKPDIDRYGIFQANNRIWCKQGLSPNFSFIAITNFSISIFKFSKDENPAMKLICIKNVYNKGKTFETLSDNLNTLQVFKNTMAAQGSFLCTATREEFQKLWVYLLDRMDECRKIDVLGWHPDGFWVFNNKVVIPGRGGEITVYSDIDKQGFFHHKEILYYVPSAKYDFPQDEAQRVNLYGDPGFTITQYFDAMIRVHGKPAYTAILFTIASIFQDIVVRSLGNFPIFFLYGPPSTGKDQLVECCQAIFGEPQRAISIDGGVNDLKPQLREFSRYSNMIIHLSEYKNGDSNLDGVLRGLWDRHGYKRGNLEGTVATHSIPILSSLFLTGSHYPDQDSLITRLICEENSKSEFSQEEIKQYDELRYMRQSGISFFTAEILQYRELWETNFKDTFHKISASLNEQWHEDDVHARIISNVAVLGTTYELMKNHIRFPFGWEDFIKRIEEGMDD